MGCKTSWTNFFVTPEPREVLRQNFGPVNKITLEVFLGQNHSPSIASAQVEMSHFETCPHFTDLLQYMTFYIDFLVYKVGDMLLIGDTILKFPWCHQKLIFGLYSTHRSRELVNDITNRHLFIRGITDTCFNWDTRGMTYAHLYTHTILEKVVRWKLRYYFESLALGYSPENLPHLLTCSTYFTS